MAPTRIAIVERTVLEWNRSELEGRLARQLDVFAARPLELSDYRTVGDKVVASSAELTLVFTVKRGQITSLEIYEAGETAPARLLVT
jgi:hypothetical protein